MKRPQKLKFSFRRKKDVQKANLSRSENHCRPQDGQINLSQDKKDAVWLQIGELLNKVLPSLFLSGKHPKERLNFKY